MLSNNCLLRFRSLCHLKQPHSHANSGTPLTVLSLSVFYPSTPIYEIDKCIGYWLSPMPTSTSIHPFRGPLPYPLSTSCPAGGGVSLAGLGARQATSGLWRAAAPRPSPCSLAPAGVSSGSSACQSDLTPTERKKNKKTHTGRGSCHFHSESWTTLQTSEPALVTSRYKFILTILSAVTCCLIFLDDLTLFIYLFLYILLLIQSLLVSHHWF